MATARCVEEFGTVLRQLRLTKDTKVAVSLSGGCDSVALLWLAKNEFSTVTAITVNHKLRAESGREADKAGEVAAGLGVKHHILSIDWGGLPPTHAIQAKARSERYKLLFRLCNEQHIYKLMTGHHFDDQIETMLIRMSKGSGIDGLCGMHTLSRRFSFPDISLIRPFLHCHKQDLQGLCVENGLNWVEDPSNHEPWCTRNRVRQFLADNADLNQAATEMHADLCRTKLNVQSQVRQLVKNLPAIHNHFGYVTLSKAKLVQLPKPIIWRVLNILSQYTSGKIRSSGYRELRINWTSLVLLDRTMTFRKALVGPIPKTKGGHDVAVCNAMDPNRFSAINITVNKSLHWENWDISLKYFKLVTTQDKERKYFVRGFRGKDSGLLKRGIRVVQSTVLPPLMVRPTFPVIVDEAENVVAIPHFKYLDRRYGVLAVVKHKPSISLDFIINRHEELASDGGCW